MTEIAQSLRPEITSHSQHRSQPPGNMILDPISLSVLESPLWESANILRGPVDAADFKTYIFPLLFFKRICNV